MVSDRGATHEAMRTRAMVDGVLCGLLFLGTVIYLRHWARDVYALDEGLFLYEAKRILDGDVFYRDFFEIVTPGAFYVMALLFALFGTSIDTSEMGMAVVHGLIAVTMYLACRQVGVRTSVATAVAVAHVAVCYPALNIASPHWFSTGLTLILLLLALRHPLSSSRRCLLLGIVVGLSIMVQQQKGVFMAAAAGFLVIVDRALEERSTAPASSLPARVVAYLGGMASIVAPALGALIITAGPVTVYHALVQFPLHNYPKVHRNITWGLYFPGVPLFILPRLIKYLPMVVLVAAARSVREWFANRYGKRLRPLMVLTIFSGFSVLSILYNPNYTHVAIITPIVLTLAAETLEWLLQCFEAMWVPRFVGATAAFAMLAGLGVQLDHNLRQWRASYPLSHETEFGRVDFADAGAIALTDTLRALASRAPSRELFVYPFGAHLYLLTGMSNPTRYQILIKDYNEPQQFDEVLAVLEAGRVPFAVIIPMYAAAKTGPIVAYVEKHYEKVRVWPRGLGGAILYRRKAAL